MIATLNKSKTALTINRQEFKLALGKIGEGIDKQIEGLKRAKQSYDPAEMAREVISEANIFEAIIEGFNEAEGTNLKLTDITNIEKAQESSSTSRGQSLKGLAPNSNELSRVLPKINGAMSVSEGRGVVFNHKRK